MQKAIEALSARIQEAGARQEVLRIVGGGTKDFLGEPLRGQVLSTEGLRGVIAYEPTELVVSAGAGTLLSDINEQLHAQGQFLPFDPPQWGAQTTLGGAIAAGLSGPARASVGSVRDYVLGAHLINGRGEALVFGGQVMKNVAGYDVSRLMAGSMGTLGVITQLSLKVLPEPLAERSLCMRGDQQAALAQLLRWRALPLPLDASCWVVDARGQGCLWLRLRGAGVAVDAAAAQMCQSAPAANLSLDDEATLIDWDAVRDQHHDFFSHPPSDDACLWRLSVPAATPVIELGLPRLMEWHGAQRWFWANTQEAHGLREWALRVGGHATLFRVSRCHGEADKAVGVFSELSAPLQAINSRLQAQFDPQGVFRTQRLG
jgi:glycolate oxidase FAD binding subunit